VVRWDGCCWSLVLLPLTSSCFPARVFDKHNALQKKHFDYRYMCFEQDFLEMLTLKEEAGMVFWFRVGRPSSASALAKSLAHVRRLSVVSESLIKAMRSCRPSWRRSKTPLLEANTTSR
jgi:hypothetical protein